MMLPKELRQQATAYEKIKPNVSPHEAFMYGALCTLDYYNVETDEIVSQPSCHCASPIPPNLEFEDITFDKIWSIYDRKDNKQNALKAWKKLTDKERARVFAHVPLFVKAHPEKKYRPMLATYLNQKRFNDEEIIDNGTKQTNLQDRLAAYATAISNVGAKG